MSFLIAQRSFLTTVLPDDMVVRHSVGDQSFSRSVRRMYPIQTGNRSQLLCPPSNKFPLQAAFIEM
jgi:hypothetical protein